MTILVLEKLWIGKFKVVYVFRFWSTGYPNSVLPRINLGRNPHDSYIWVRLAKNDLLPKSMQIGYHQHLPKQRVFVNKFLNFSYYIKMDENWNSLPRQIGTNDLVCASSFHRIRTVSILLRSNYIIFPI